MLILGGTLRYMDALSKNYTDTHKLLCNGLFVSRYMFWRISKCVTYVEVLFILLVVMYNIRWVSCRSEFLLFVVHLVKLLFIIAHPLFRIYTVSGN